VSFADDTLAGINLIYEVGGIPVVYTDRNGVTKTVTAIVNYEIATFGTVADVSGKTASISVRVSDMANKPRRGETYTVGATVYVVDSILRADELEHEALVA
jgi:hypothetical protein